MKEARAQTSRSIEHQWAHELGAQQTSADDLGRVAKLRRKARRTSRRNEAQQADLRTRPHRLSSIAATLRDTLRQSRGRLLLRWTLVTGLGACGYAALHLLYVNDAVSTLAGAAAESAWNVSIRALIIGEALLAVLSAAAWLLVTQTVIRPFERERDAFSMKLRDLESERDAESHRTSAAVGRHGERLEALLADNEYLRQERKAIQEDRRTAANLLHAVVDHAPDRLVVLDRSGRVLDVSPPAEALFGSHRSVLVGMRFDAAIRLFDSQYEAPREHPLHDLAANILESASPIPKLAHVLVEQPGGEDCRLILVAAAICGENGELEGAYLRFEDEVPPGIKAAKRSLSARLAVDRVTGLPSYEAFEQRLGELIALARGGTAAHTLVVVAIDDYWESCGRLGHRAGDELRWHAAKLVQLECGNRLQAFVLAPDSFGIPLAQLDLSAAKALARTVSDRVSGRTFSWSGAEYECSVSCGVVALNTESESVESELERAYEAIAKARAPGLGRGQVLSVEDEEHPEIARRRGDKGWADWAISRLQGGFAHLTSQKIAALDTRAGRKPGCEVYLRIEDEDGAWVAPSAYLKAAERYGHGAQLDAWVIETALGELGGNQELIADYDFVSINISAQTLRDPEFARKIVSMITMSGVSGERLWFEIDESDLVSEISVATRFIMAVRTTGARIAVDRYRGIGDPRYLEELPIDAVKLHQSLTRRFGAPQPGSTDALLLNFFQKQCAQRGIMAVASGIETQTELQAMREAGFAYGQGIAIDRFGPVLV